MVGMSHEDRTRAYVPRRLPEGKTKREVMHILKRYIASEVYKNPPRG